jgi:hypothetical protein
MLKYGLFVAACGLAIGAAAPASAQTFIDTTGSNAGTVFDFGQPDTSAYGETFTVGSDNVLNNFSLYLVNHNNDLTSPPINFNAYIYAWNGSQATGSALYSSGVQSFTGSASPTEYAFNTGNLSLTSGSQYVAFLFASSGGLAGMPFPTGDAYSGGTFVFNNAGSDFSSLTTTGWSTFSNNDVWFKAAFNAGSAVPEPATWAMMLVGFAGMGAAMRRDRKRTAAAIA